MEDVRRRVMSKDIKLQSNEPGPATDPLPANRADTPAALEQVFESEITESIDERYYYIPGERFIIKYEDVKNMNITYYSEEAHDTE
jgi:hypothetical protein